SKVADIFSISASELPELTGGVELILFLLASREVVPADRQAKKAMTGHFCALNCALHSWRLRH
ncbi:hypothetical protein, partial [Pseudomonas viridiflava]|uniref:hypothetical protein n=1 Tax=Pseudomonas viridiflava TaxID=33069 RepID=UPI0019CFAA8A